MTTQTIIGAMNQRLGFEFQSLSPRMSMQARGTAGHDASTLRNIPISQSLNSKTYSTVRGSVPLPRPVKSNMKSSELTGAATSFTKQGARMPSIINHTDQRQPTELTNRLATARNTTIEQPPDHAYGTLTAGFLISNRHVRTNQQHQRKDGVGGGKDYISLKEDAPGSDFIGAIHGGASVASTLKPKDSSKKDDSAEKQEQPEAFGDSEAARVSLAIVPSDSWTSKQTQLKLASAEIQRLKHVYNGLLPLSNSSNQMMGVSIRSQPPATSRNNVKVADEREDANGFNALLG